MGGRMRGLHQQIAADLVASTAEDGVRDVLEIGPGPGVMAVELARLAPSVQVTGVAVDPALGARATSRAERAGLGDRVSFLVGDAAKLPFRDGSFDLVTSAFSAHHWADAAAGFAEIRRVLRPGASAIVYDLPDRWVRFERHAAPLASAATQGGLAGSTTSAFRWPWRVPIATRLEYRASAG
jgi:ubiquinone/menaquinone biosynthesis C-methylase UbiE